MTNEAEIREQGDMDRRMLDRTLDNIHVVGQRVLDLVANGAPSEEIEAAQRDLRAAISRQDKVVGATLKPFVQAMESMDVDL